MTRSTGSHAGLLALVVGVVLAGCSLLPQLDGRAGRVPRPSSDTSMVPPPEGVHAVAQELDRLAQPFPAAAGGGYWDTGRRSYVYRVLPDAPGSRELRDTIQRVLVAAAPLPAPFLIEEGRVSTGDLIAAADRLNADFGWAHPFEDEVHQVLADRLHGLLRVNVRAHPDEIAQLAAERARIDAYATVSEQGGQPQ